MIGVLRLTLALQAHTIDGPNPFAVLSTKPVIPTRVPRRRICADLADIATRHGVPGHLDRVMIPGPPHSVLSVKLYVVLERFLQFHQRRLAVVVVDYIVEAVSIHQKVIEWAGEGANLLLGRQYTGR